MAAEAGIHTGCDELSQPPATGLHFAFNCASRRDNSRYLVTEALTACAPYTAAYIDLTCGYMNRL